MAGLACVAALAACGSPGSETASDADEDVASLGTVEPVTEATDSGDSGSDETDGSTEDTTTGDSVDPEEAFVEYTECMRDEGIDMPDPQFSSAEPGQSGQVVTVNSFDGDPQAEGPRIDFDSEEYAEANDACGSILDDAFGDIEIDPELEAEQREQMLAFAQCMRDQGLDFPDPVFNDNGGVMTMIGDEDGEGDRPSLEEMEAAQEACADEMPDGAFVAGGRAED